MVGTRWKDWKTIPTCLRRKRARSSSPIAVRPRRLRDESPWWVPEVIDDRVFAKISSGIQGLAQLVKGSGCNFPHKGQGNVKVGRRHRAPGAGAKLPVSPVGDLHDDIRRQFQAEKRAHQLSVFFFISGAKPSLGVAVPGFGRFAGLPTFFLLR